MKSYSNYKDSGVKWLGQIPQHWEVRKIKYVFTERTEKGFPEEPVLCSTQKHGVIPQSMYENRVVVVNKGLDGLKLVRKGDFVISLRSFQGGIEYAYYQGIISAAYTILEKKDNVSADYLKYLLKSHRFIQLLQTCVTGIREGQNINYGLLRKSFLPVPPLSEQLSIVSYLDGKVSAMDRLMLLTQQKVEHLKALKQAIIQEAVTTGIPNKNHILKQTNIKWIKQIPQHWEVKKIKYILAECTEKGFPNEPVLCSTQKYGVIPQSMYENRVVVVNKGLEGLKLVRRGDFVISLRSFQGGIEYAHYQGIISAAYTVLRLQDDVNPNYLRILFKTQCFIQLLQTCVTGIREGQNINYGLLRKNSIPLPPLSEQEEIVAYLDEKTAKIDLLIDKELQQIDHIKDLKQTLIADVVTGKVDVTTKH